MTENSILFCSQFSSNIYIKFNDTLVNGCYKTCSSSVSFVVFDNSCFKKMPDVKVQYLALFYDYTGHNWGSEHDPDTPECAPDSAEGGRYIMYPSAVSGYQANNDVSMVTMVTTHRKGSCIHHVSIGCQWLPIQ